MNIKALAIPLLALVLMGCNESQESTDSKPNDKEQKTLTTVSSIPATADETKNKMALVKKDIDLEAGITLKGVMQYKELEGGFYAFASEGGQNFILQGLAPEYLRHGLVISVTGVPKPELVTIQNYGTVFEVFDVTVLDESNASDANAKGITH